MAAQPVHVQGEGGAAAVPARPVLYCTELYCNVMYCTVLYLRGPYTALSCRGTRAHCCAVSSSAAPGEVRIGRGDILENIF